MFACRNACRQDVREAAIWANKCNYKILIEKPKKREKLRRGSKKLRNEFLSTSGLDSLLRRNDARTLLAVYVSDHPVVASGRVEIGSRATTGGFGFSIWRTLCAAKLQHGDCVTS